MKWLERAAARLSRGVQEVMEALPYSVQRGIRQRQININMANLAAALFSGHSPEDESVLRMIDRISDLQGRLDAIAPPQEIKDTLCDIMKWGGLSKLYNDLTARKTYRALIAKGGEMIGMDAITLGLGVAAVATGPAGMTALIAVNGAQYAGTIFGQTMHTSLKEQGVDFTDPASIIAAIYDRPVWKRAFNQAIVEAGATGVALTAGVGLGAAAGNAIGPVAGRYIGSFITHGGGHRLAGYVAEKLALQASNIGARAATKLSTRYALATAFLAGGAAAAEEVAKAEALPEPDIEIAQAEEIEKQQTLRTWYTHYPF